MLNSFPLTVGTSEQPQNVTAVGISSREINLTWMAPHDNNAPITGYQVMYLLPEFVVGERLRVVNTSVVMAIISELLPGADYTFSVTALNEIGQSVPSDPLTVRTLDEGDTKMLKALLYCLCIYSPWSSPQCHGHCNIPHLHHGYLGHGPSHGPEWGHHYV